MKPFITDTRQRGISQVVVASLIRGFQGFFARITEWVPYHVIPLSFFRLAIPACAVYAYLALRGNRIRNIFTKEKTPLHITSLVTALRLGLFLAGYVYADMSSATVVFFASTIFIVLLEPLFLGERFRAATLWAALLGFAGVVVVFLDQAVSLHNTGFIGLVFMSASALLVILENFLKKRYVSLVTTTEWVFYQGLISSILFLPSLFFFPLPDPRAFLWILLFAFSIGIVAFMLDISAFRHVRISDLSVTRYIEPTATMMVGFIIFGEAVTAHKIFGALLVFLSVYMVFKQKKEGITLHQVILGEEYDQRRK